MQSAHHETQLAPVVADGVDVRQGRGVLVEADFEAGLVAPARRVCAAHVELVDERPVFQVVRVTRLVYT